MQEEQQTRQAVSRLMSKIRQNRDELRLQIHLAGREAKEEWDRLSDRFVELNQQWLPLEKAVGETARGVWNGIQMAGEEILDGFRKIQNSLKDR